jgi:hypothetical protein
VGQAGGQPTMDRSHQRHAAAARSWSSHNAVTDTEPGGHPVGLEYRVMGVTCVFRYRFDHAVIWYSLMSPLSIGLRRTW